MLRWQQRLNVIAGVLVATLLVGGDDGLQPQAALADAPCTCPVLRLGQYSPTSWVYYCEYHPTEVCGEDISVVYLIGNYQWPIFDCGDLCIPDSALLTPEEDAPQVYTGHTMRHVPDRFQSVPNPLDDTLQDPYDPEGLPRLELLHSTSKFNNYHVNLDGDHFFKVYEVQLYLDENDVKPKILRYGYEIDRPSKFEELGSAEYLGLPGQVPEKPTKVMRGYRRDDQAQMLLFLKKTDQE